MHANSQYTKQPMIRTLIADDHLIIRQGLRLILETEDDLEIIGEACDGAEAVRLCTELHPDVVLMDLRMPGMDGLTAIEKIRTTQPEIAVVILTTYNEDDLMLRGLQAGARGFLLKDTNRSALFDTIRAAARGETLLKPEIVARVISKAGMTFTRTETGSPSYLTEREGEVLAAVAKGERSKEIAAHLSITERTVKAHLASIYSKLGVDSRAAAIAIAAQKGLLK
jgi:NarL family two-component system response regulator YdfI